MTDELVADVVGIVRETVALPESHAISPEALLFYDLGFTSMDMLDMLFRLEQRFTIEIPEGTIARLARGGLSGGEFAQDGTLTALGRQRLMEMLHDSPLGIFPDRIHESTLPRYCTVGAIARLVEHLLSQK